MPAEEYPSVRALKEHRRVGNVEMGTIKDSGDVSWISVTAAPLPLEGYGVVIAFGDITERKRAEDELTQSHDLLTNLARLVPGVIYQYRLYPDGRSAFPYSSPGMNDIYEVTPEEVREDATPVFGRLHPDDYDFVADAIAESARTLQTFYCEFRVVLPRQGLRWRWSQAHPERTADGGTLWHGIISDVTERKMVEEQLKQASIHDALTGLYNRRLFEEEMARLDRGRRFPVSIVMADLNHLKVTNDRDGHAAGDVLLQRCAEILSAAFRAEDVIARIGGDEFAVLLPDTDVASAEQSLRRVRCALDEHNAAFEGISLSIAFGVSTAEQGVALTEALKEADARMYEDKQGC
jgi:diguanylate cyclase (GGDEF)-like protein